MDSDQELLDSYNAREEAREAEEWKLKKAAQMRFESAAKRAHAVRCMHRLLISKPVPVWDDLALTSQRHLIADAENVAENPAITSTELNLLYQERLKAWGDSASVDLQVWNQESLTTEEQVLRHLKESLVGPSNTSAEPLKG